MGIIFVNLKAMENRDNLNVKPQGDTELEKAQYVYEYIKKAVNGKYFPTKNGNYFPAVSGK